MAIFDTNKTIADILMSNEFVEFFKQLFIVTFGVLAGSLVSFRLLWPKVESYMLKLSVISQSRRGSKVAQQLRFAAYERLVLLAHRIDPHEVMLRNHTGDTNLVSFVRNLVGDVESEYQHNLAQQLYVSSSAWQYITELKSDTVNLLRNVSDALPQEATIDHYIGTVLKHLRDVEESPYLSVQRLLKEEMNR